MNIEHNAVHDDGDEAAGEHADEDDHIDSGGAEPGVGLVLQEAGGHGGGGFEGPTVGVLGGF